MKSACHKTVRDVAQAAAGELYETLMGDDVVWAEWRKQNPGLTRKQLESRFISKNWPKCIAFARATLAHMLTRPYIEEKVKEEILEVLILDASVPVGRTPPQKAVQILNLELTAKQEGWKP